MAYELLSQSRKLNKWGGRNKSGENRGRGKVGKSFEKKNKRMGRLLGTLDREYFHYVQT